MTNIQLFKFGRTVFLLCVFQRIAIILLRFQKLIFLRKNFPWTTIVYYQQLTHVIKSTISADARTSHKQEVTVRNNDLAKFGTREAWTPPQTYWWARELLKRELLRILKEFSEKNKTRQENDSQETKQQKWDNFKLFCNRKALHSTQVTKFIALNAVVFPCCSDPLEGGGTIYSNGFFFVPWIFAARYIHRRELRLVSLESSSSVEYGIKFFFHFRFLQGVIEV